MSGGGEHNVAGLWLDFAANRANAFFKFDDEQGIAADFLYVDGEIERQVVGPVKFLIAVAAVAVEAAEVGDELWKEWGFELPFGGGVAPLFGGGNEVSIAEPLRWSGLCIDGVEAVVAIGCQAFSTAGQPAMSRSTARNVAGAQRSSPPAFRSACGGWRSS